jgi:FkbM family methyltransferase
MNFRSRDHFSDFFNRNFIFCDVGARWGLEEPWKTQRNFIDVVSFEPDKEEYEILNRRKKQQDIVLPYALCNEEKQLSFNLTKNRGCSSIYQPNLSYLERFPDVERFTVEEKTIVDSTTLDHLYDRNIIKNVDFIKLDTQGSELDILKGGEKLINEQIIGIQVEVEFKPMYKSQPLFHDIDIFLREKLGFELFDIRKSYFKYNEGRGIGPSKGQLMFGDALYFRNPYEMPQWCGCFEDEEIQNKIIMACFMGVLYGYPDYSLCLLEKAAVVNSINLEKYNKLKSFIIKDAHSIKYSFKGSGKIWNLLRIISKAFEPDTEGWSLIEWHLGSRKKFRIYY